MKVSIIIPTLNEAENIAGCLNSVDVQEGEFEIIVVDGGSADGTPDLIRSRARVVEGARGRALQMNAGAQVAGGDVLLFLHADSRMHPEGLKRMRQVMRSGQVVGGTFTLRFDSDKVLLRLYSFLTRFKFRYFHYGDQGIFVRRQTFEEMNGFAVVPFMEDVDFLRRLRKAGRVALIPLPVTTSARRFLRHGLFRQQIMNVMLVSLYTLGVKPETLSRWYLPHTAVGREDKLAEAMGSITAKAAE